MILPAPALVVLLRGSLAVALRLVRLAPPVVMSAGVLLLQNRQRVLVQQRVGRCIVVVRVVVVLVLVAYVCEDARVAGAGVDVARRWLRTVRMALTVARGALAFSMRSVMIRGSSSADGTRVASARRVAAPEDFIIFRIIEFNCIICEFCYEVLTKFSNLLLK